ncbi:zinc finger protein-like 1 [Ischnura elegans]|uniref:zinc finger protein-like 1 n=1 Tax=Ischnura elegans TaxID=197161 RepID=UPI001ED875B6|nr:zinc finger protein-like 1 [Ischnura elegans]
MGLCKCPKRVVTNLFCYEHRVNVCEHCMVASHAKCIVQSYLKWLHDSDYNPICELCSKDLASGDCLRLTCFHVYHWACLDRYARQLPPTTAPAGYTCPTCKEVIFPSPNLVSPVADVLRQVLAGVNWARTGLGLPLLSEEREHKTPVEVEEVSAVEDVAVSDARPNAVAPQPMYTHPPTNRQATGSNSAFTTAPPDSSPASSVIHVDDGISDYMRTESFPLSSDQPPKRVFEALDVSKEEQFDHDENKYKRRSAIEWFSRWWKNRQPVRSSRGGGHLYRRYWMAALLFAIGLLTLVVIFSKLGRIATADDPNLDPLQNPNIHINNNNK